MSDQQIESKILSYDGESTFSIQVETAKPGSKRVLKRKLADLKQLGRAIRKQKRNEATQHGGKVDGFPKSTFLKLQREAWSRQPHTDVPVAKGTTNAGEDGDKLKPPREESSWKACLSKPVGMADAWLKTHLKLLSAEERAFFLDDIVNEKFHTEKSDERNRTARARKLQQYFVSDANISLVLEHMFPKENLDTDKANTKYVVLEPSCGDGRLLEKLAQICVRKNEVRKSTHGSCVATFGCEIDPYVGKVAKHRFFKENVSRGGIGIHVHIGDFLKTTTFMLSNWIESCVHEADILTSSIPRLLVVGCPPYQEKGVKDGINSTPPSGADLIFQFLVHSANILKAERIVIIAPTRCGKHRYVAQCLQEMNKSGNWILAEQVEGDKHFELAGSVVKIPSILQVYERQFEN